MGSIYIAIVKGEADWITFASAHLLKDALPNCAGIYWFDPDNPKGFMTDTSEGWSLYLCGHGNEHVICGLSGETLAKKLGPHLPNTLGMIFVQSCMTGQGPAQEFRDNLRNKNIILKAPNESSTFTQGLGFRVLDPPTFTDSLKRQYRDLCKRYTPTGGDAGSLAKHKKSGNEISAQCKKMYTATAKFWPAFNRKFAGCFSATGMGWKELHT